MADLSIFRRTLDVARTIDPVSVIHPNERHAKSIKDVGMGGVIRLDGEVFVVRATSTLTQTKDDYKALPKNKAYVATEFTLFSLKTGEVRYIEWGIDDELEISFTEAKISRADLRNRLKYDDGEVVDVDDVDEIIEEEEDLVFNGRTYHYSDDWPAKFKSSDGRAFYAYLYEFEDANGHQLTIEGWSNDGDEDGEWEYEVFLSRPVDPLSVEIISLGGQ